MTPDAIIGIRQEEGRFFLPGTVFTYTCVLCGAKVGLAPSGQKKQQKLGLKVMCMPCALAKEEAEIILPTREDLISDLLHGGRN